MCERLTEICRTWFYHLHLKTVSIAAAYPFFESQGAPFPYRIEILMIDK